MDKIDQMKATELRIGNYVRAKSPEKKEWVEAHKISAHTLYSMVYPTAMDFVKPDMEPIPITEEWLLKFGFENSKTRDKYFTKDNTFGISTDGNKFRFIQGNFICQLVLRDLKYLHELQNLYFALTGNELQING